MHDKNRLEQYQNAKNEAEHMEVEDIIWQMTICDIEQFLTDGKLDVKKADAYFHGHAPGGVLAPKTSPNQAAEYIRQFKKYIKDHTNGIPPLVISEMLHGVTSPQMTVFPQSLAMGAAFDRDLTHRVACAIGDEAESIGINQGLAPVLDLALDPRWGRVEECYGEDPYLVSELGKQYVSGVQYASDKRLRIAATVKHFAVHGNPEGGVNLAASSVGEREIRRLYLKPFREVITSEHPLSVMPAYSENDGIPCHQNQWLLEEILRKELGFEGYLISDFEAIDMLHTLHHTASSQQEALIFAFTAGVDLEAPGMKDFALKMKQLVSRGLLSAELLKQRVANILFVKHALHLFDEPTASSAMPDFDMHRELALEAARKSIVLLENRGNILPIRAGQYANIAVIGPAGKTVEFGDYSIRKEVSAVWEEIAAAFPESRVTYAPGCEYFDADEKLLAQANQAAEEADCIILAVGERSVTNFGIGWGVEDATISLCGEGYDSCTLRLSPAQETLCREILSKGKPVILLQIGGRPLALGDLYTQCQGILHCFYGGEMFAKAAADILSGKICPSGRLPVSIPRSVGNLPCYYHHKPSSRGFYHRPGSLSVPGRDYVTETPGALYSFGYGKSYTEFVYENLIVDTADFAEKGCIHATVTVKNTGTMDAEDVVLLYVRDLVSSVTVPVRELKGFARVFVPHGEQVQVSFTIDRKEFCIWDAAMRFVLEPGDFAIAVGDLTQIITL